MSTNPTRPTQLPPPTPPSAPSGAALPLPTAAPCVDCGTTGGYATHVLPDRKRGLCVDCYNRHYRNGTYTDFALTDRSRDPEGFTGLPEGYTHEPTGWPIVPAFHIAPHPYYPETTRWFTCEGRLEDEWSRRPVANTAAPRNRPIAWPAPWHRPLAELQAEFFGDEAQAA